MKIRRRALIVVLCVLLVFSFSAVVYASASKMFFTKTAYGYSCTGRGNITGTVGTSTLSSTPKPMEPIIPQEACTVTTWVAAYDNNGRIIGDTHNIKYESVNVQATYRATESISKIGCGFTFNDVHFGYYYLYNI